MTTKLTGKIRTRILLCVYENHVEKLNNMHVLLFDSILLLVGSDSELGRRDFNFVTASRERK